MNERVGFVTGVEDYQDKSTKGGTVGHIVGQVAHVQTSTTHTPRHIPFRTDCSLLGWYAVRKILVSLWAVIFILIVFRIPLLPQWSVSLADGVGLALHSLGVMAATSPYFRAMYTAIIAALISMRVERPASFLKRIGKRIGVGSYMNINGTLINVFVLGAIVIMMLGLNVSVAGLPLMVPVVFLISYGVSGITGELVLLGGPMATLLSIPVEVLPISLASISGYRLAFPTHLERAATAPMVTSGPS